MHPAESKPGGRGTAAAGWGRGRRAGQEPAGRAGRLGLGAGVGAGGRGAEECSGRNYTGDDAVTLAQTSRNS